MEKDRKNEVIKLPILEKLQSLFQKDKNELIDLYLDDATLKISHLFQALENNNFLKLGQYAQDLRHRSIDIGAIQFTHFCLTIEIAAAEHRFESIRHHLALLENQFRIVKEYFETLKEKT